MSAETSKILARAASQPLCDVVVIGTLPGGQGMYMDWNGETIASLIMRLEAAKLEAVRTYVDGINGRGPAAIEAAE